MTSRMPVERSALLFGASARTTPSRSGPTRPISTPYRNHLQVRFARLLRSSDGVGSEGTDAPSLSESSVLQVFDLFCDFRSALRTDAGDVAGEVVPARLAAACWGAPVTVPQANCRDGHYKQYRPQREADEVVLSAVLRMGEPSHLLRSTTIKPCQVAGAGGPPTWSQTMPFARPISPSYAILQNSVAPQARVTSAHKERPTHFSTRLTRDRRLIALSRIPGRRRRRCRSGRSRTGRTGP